MDIEFYSLFYIVWLVSAKVIGVVGVEGDLVSSVRSQRAVLFPQYTVLQVSKSFYQAHAPKSSKDLLN